MATFKCSEKVEISGTAADGRGTWEAARIIRRNPKHGPVPTGYRRVKFQADGAALLVHESRMRSAA